MEKFNNKPTNEFDEKAEYAKAEPESSLGALALVHEGVHSQVNCDEGWNHPSNSLVGRLE